MTEFASFLGSQALSDVELVCVKRRRVGPAGSTAAGGSAVPSPSGQDAEVRRFPGHAVTFLGEFVSSFAFPCVSGLESEHSTGAARSTL